MSSHVMSFSRAAMSCHATDAINHTAHGMAAAKQGEIGDTFFILKEGRALVTQTSKSGDKQLRRMEEYSCFGERALLTAEPRSANVIAETKVGWMDGGGCLRGKITDGAGRLEGGR